MSAPGACAVFKATGLQVSCSCIAPRFQVVQLEFTAMFIASVRPVGSPGKGYAVGPSCFPLYY